MSKAKAPTYDGGLFDWKGSVGRGTWKRLGHPDPSRGTVTVNGVKKVGFFITVGEEKEFFEHVPAGEEEEVVWTSNHWPQPRVWIESELWSTAVSASGRKVMLQYGGDEFRRSE